MVRQFAKRQGFELFDLSVPISSRTAEPDPPHIDYVDHRRSARELSVIANHMVQNQTSSAGATFTEHSFLDGMGLANENLRLDTHAGTHMDAPWHFGPHCAGKPTKTIDEIPLDWCFGPGVILDVRHKKSGDMITPQDLQEALDRIHYQLRPDDIVLIMTGADKHFEQADYFSAHAGMGREATVWLLDQHIRVIGIDSWGFDRPAGVMLQEYMATRDAAALFPGHMVGRDREYCHIEKLANLDRIPVPFGFWVSCFPVKVERGSAGWVRAVALVPEVLS